MLLSQLDALLETDSDDDCLVVDDQSEACEVTTSCNEVENTETDPTAEQGTQERVKDRCNTENQIPLTYKSRTGKITIQTSHDTGIQKHHTLKS